MQSRLLRRFYPPTMIPLDFLRGLPQPSSLDSLGDVLATDVSNSHIVSLLDCIPLTSAPAIFSPDLSRPPLNHDTLRSFVQHFALPTKRQLSPNQRVMVALPTGPENAVALLAIAAYHTAAPVNAACTPTELLDDARRLRARVILTTRDAKSRLELDRLAQELDCEIVFLEPRFSGPCGLFDMAAMNSPTQTPPCQPTELHRLADQSLILHTSGTSGKKKVVPYSLLSLVVGTCAVVQSWDLREADVNLNMMPLFHVGGIVRNLLAPVFSGGSAIICAGFDAMAFWTLARDLQASWYYAAPTIHHAILTSQPAEIVPSRDLRIRMIANAAGGLLPSLAVSLKSTFGAVILPSYGMTECMPIASPPISYQLDRPGCSGVACGPHLSIRDPSNLEHELPRGKTGAICVRGLPTFEGYEVEPGEALDTSTFTTEGWFDSGDCGHMDQEGYLFITGRSKEIINKGGEVISPFEVEEAIVTAAKGHVKTTLAFGIEHDVLQETIGVVIVAEPDRPRIGLNQLLDLLKDHLHPSKWPFAIVYMEDVPKNQAGKPLRIKLANRLGIGKLSDSVSPVSRHYEATLPADQSNLSEPIPCQNVEVDFDSVVQALRTVYGVADAALRSRGDNSLEAFVCVEGIDASDVSDALKRQLPGYAIPAPIHIVPGERSVPKAGSGAPDFGAMEAAVARGHAAALSEHARLVRDIVGNLLLADAKLITPDADFFLLGGNSLLLGKLAHQIRRRTGVAIGVQALFANSTIQGIASMIESENKPNSNQNPFKDPQSGPNISARTSEATLNMGYDYEEDVEVSQEKTRGQAHPLTLIVQLLPVVLFYPLKTAMTWTILLLMLSLLAPHVGSFWGRLGALLASIVVARLATRIIAPLTSILFKWLIIGKYSPGTYPMWSTYYLRYWIVNQSIRVAGRGVFSMHPCLERLYYRLLGARIGRNVTIEKGARLGEYDLLTFRDGCRVDRNTVIRGFCVEREGCFRLDPIVIGERSFVNSYTQLAPGSIIPDNTVYGPHSSGRDSPSPRSYAAFNRTLIAEPNGWLKLFIAWPIIALVHFVSYIPWFVAIWLMVHRVDMAFADNLNAVEAVVYWFSSPERVAYHALSRVVRAVITPLLRLVCGILVKRAFGLNREMVTADMTQWVHLRRYINSVLLSQSALKSAFSILGTHYEVISIIYRSMGATIGKRVYWPGSGIYCPDPELLEIGNDVVFGSRSEIFTTDRIGSARITVGDGAMIADRVILLPGCKVGRQTVMGSGALGMRDTDYKDGSTWLGTECLDEGTKSEHSDTTTPFGRAFYQRQADYWVMPYWVILSTNILVATLSAAYWSISAVAAAQVLRVVHLHHGKHFHIYRKDWYRPGYLYGFIAMSFVVVLNLQVLIALLWVIVSKWIVIGRRKDGRYSWDKSSYCQRWQLHLTMSRLIYKGYGNGGLLAPLTGTAYIVMYFRALGAKIGKNVALYPGGYTGLMTEPDLVQLGANVSLDDCSVVAHINSRGNFALNSLSIGNGCALRTGSRLLSGASMEDSSMLLEHTLLTSGEVADAGVVYSGWPAKPVDDNWQPRYKDDESSGIICPQCRNFPKDMTTTPCGHIFCHSCISDSISTRNKCPVCAESIFARNLRRIYPSFAL